MFADQSIFSLFDSFGKYSKCFTAQTPELKHLGANPTSAIMILTFVSQENSVIPNA